LQGSPVDIGAAVLNKSLSQGSPVDIEAAVLNKSLSQGSPEDLGAVVLDKSLFQGRQSDLGAPGPSSLTETEDAAALGSCLGFSAAVVVPALLDVCLGGHGPEPRPLSLMRNGLVLIRLPAAMVAAVSVHLPQSFLLAAVVQGPIPLGDSSDARDRR
jgi:hypothetical protein